MKTPRILLSVLPPLLAALSGNAIAADSITPVGGTYVYSQNFNTLFMPAAAGSVATAGATNWADGVTIPNWFYHGTTNAAATATGVYGGASLVYYGNDGSAAPVVTTFNSAGAANDPDRAFCIPSTTARCEVSAIVYFQNNSTKAVDLTRIQYNGEVRRANSGANNVETIFPYYKIGDSEAALRTMTTENLAAAAAAAKFPAAVSTTPTAGYFLTGWTAVPAANFTYSNATANAVVNVSTPVDANNLAGIRLAPGKFIAVRFSGINDAGTDALMGFDDLSITFTEQDVPLLSATVTNVMRNDPSNTPTDPTDDTITYTLDVVASGAGVGLGWDINPPSPLAGSGSYGTPQNFTIPISAFNTAPHSVTASIVDNGGSGATTDITITAPWCVLTGATATSFTYNDNATLDPIDDVLGYNASVNGTYTGASFTVTGGTPAPATAAYGSAAAMTPVSGTTETLTFTDSADAACTATLVVHNAAIIGANTVGGGSLPIRSLPAFGTRAWTLSSTARTATQNGATQVDHTILSEEIDLSSTGAVLVTATLEAPTGASSGFEAPDHFQLDLIVDGGAPVSMLGAADADRDGLLEGAATNNNAATWVELPDAGDQNIPAAQATYNFSAVISPAATRVQIRIIGSSNSPNETFIFKNLTFADAPPALLASAGAATLDNRGTVDPSDDTLWNVPVDIFPVNLGASTGWLATSLAAPDAPLSGNYTAANPVLFSLALPVAPATTRTVTLVDQLDANYSVTLNIAAPAARTFTAALAAVPNIVRNENGPGVEDDTVSFDITVSGLNGGPQYTLATGIGSATATSNALTTTPTTHTVTVSAVPALASTIYVRALDASYPASAANIAVAVPAPTTPPTDYVIGQKDFGGGPSDVLSTGAPLPAQWQNYRGLRALSMHNGATAGTVTSEVIDLTTVGDVAFSARLRGIDTSSGFEDTDTFTAVLIINGDTLNPVRTTDAADLDLVKNGLEGVEIVGAGGTFAVPVVATSLLSAIVPATADSVQLVITGLNNSANEQMVLDNVLFGLSIGPVDTDLDGMTDDYENANGLNANDPGDKLTDLDGDGQSNYAEFLAGTSANNSGSTLKVTSIVPSGNPNEYSVSFDSVAGKKYQLQESSDLGVTDSWADVPGVVTATGASTTVNIPTAGLGSKHFVRIKVVP